jgi:hypothetical protein
MIKNKLWKPPPEYKTTVTKTYSIYDDEICPDCANVNVCRTPCRPITWINGKTASKEPLLSDLSDTIYYERDYKDVLAEMIDNEQEKERRSFESILNEKDIRLKAIHSMLFFSIPIPVIAKLLSLHRSRIYQLTPKKIRQPKHAPIR